MMADQQVVDITQLASLGGQFPRRLMQLGFRLMQVMDEQEKELFRFVLPPVCEVPAGPFLMGSDQRYDPKTESIESPQHTVRLAAYHISTYPLTVTEYGCFVQSPQRAEFADWQQFYPDHPIVSVTWTEALAYTQWLAEVSGEPWRLPTEAEWEKAARGTDGRLYPWGNQWDNTRAYTYDGGPTTTSSVGSYPSGASPYGVQDMASNVFEWTSSIFMSYPYQADDGREDLNDDLSKVLRGGGGYNTPLHMRAARRLNNDPLATNPRFGVRLVRGSRPDE